LVYQANCVMVTHGYNRSPFVPPKSRVSSNNAGHMWKQGHNTYVEV